MAPKTPRTPVQMQTRAQASADMTNVQRTVTLSDEQFQALLNRVTPSTPRMESSPGNFINCTSRFRGEPTEDVDIFIDAVTTYKECASVSDEIALRGVSMLLEGNAAVWWKGVKSTISEWNSAVESLRKTYSRKLPTYLVFRGIFDSPQKAEEPTEHFICEVRAKLAQLPYKVQEEMELDMLFGLLKRSVRSRINRADIRSFEGLLTQAREIEITFREMKQNIEKEQSDKNRPTARGRPKCTFCKNFGHSASECRKAANAKPDSSTQLKNPPASVSLKCYGCQTPGYIRTNCPKCNPNSKTLEFSTVTTCDDCNLMRPCVKVEVEGHLGSACLDTGAKRSLAGAQLTKLLLDDGVPYQCEDVYMRFADGNQKLVRSYVFHLYIHIEGRAVPIRLLAVPEHVNSNMLLGMDFITAAEIIIDVASGFWHFRGEDDKPRAFLAMETFNMNVVDVNDAESVSLREDESSSLVGNQKAVIDSLLCEYSDLFGTSQEPTPFAEHSIKLTDDTPISVAPYRLSEPKRRYLEGEIEQMLLNDVIEESDSAYAAPVVMVPKGNSKTDFRVCVDYRQLNARTIPDRYPLPRLDDLLHEAKRTAYMTTLDLRSGYWQVAIKPEDRDKTGFVTPFGNYRFKRMPFGLRNAPATFQRLVDRMKNKLQDVTILTYLDDIIIISESFEKHMTDIRRVFERIRHFKLRINREKCKFVASEVKYLGHIITTTGIKTNPEKVAAIQTIPPPRNVRELLTFLQTVSWFRKFIPECAAIMKPLTQLTKKNAEWRWGEQQSDAFESLKKKLTTAPILKQADYTQPYLLRCDASAYALGAALLQGEPPNEHPVEYASRLLTPAERNYSTTEREALAVVWAIQKFQGYLESSPIQILSDHQPLRWLMAIKSPNGRLARWALALQSYDLQIDYVSGKSNALADTLSRLPFPPETDACQVTVVDMPTTTYDQIRQEQLKDPELSEIIAAIESHTDLVGAKRAAERGYVLVNGVLYRYPPNSDEEEAVQVVPVDQIPDILYEYHDSPLAGHYGYEKTYEKIRKRFYWTGMRKMIQNHVATCIECQRFKPRNTKLAGLLQTPVQNRRFEVLAMDLFGPLPETPANEQWIFAIEDTTTRWIELFALKQATAEACARCLIDEVILRYGTPRRIISDNGPQFIGEVMQSVAHALGFKQSLTPVYHPEANPVERKNRDLKTQLAILTATKHTEWAMHLPGIRFAMNTSTSLSTEATPAYLMFGRELRTPDDVERDLRAIVQHAPFVNGITSHLLALGETLAEAREVCERKQDTAKANADERRKPGPSYNIGDKVLVDVHALSKGSRAYTSKFAPRRDGPYVIVKVVSPTTYQVAAATNLDVPLGTYHTSALTFYKEPAGIPDPIPLHPLRRRGRPKKTTTPPVLDNTRGAKCRPKGETVTPLASRRPRK